jgi:hypothetical protein
MQPKVSFIILQLYQVISLQSTLYFNVMMPLEEVKIIYIWINYPLFNKCIFFRDRFVSFHLLCER